MHNRVYKYAAFLCAVILTVALASRALARDDDVSELCSAKPNRPCLTKLALTAVQTIDTRQRDWTLKEIAKAQANAGHFTDALVTTDVMNHMLDRIETIVQIGSAQVQAGENRAARETFASAVKFGHAIENALDRAKGLREIGTVQSQVDRTAATKTLTHAAQAVMAIDDHNSRIEWLTEVAKAQLEINDGEGARATVKTALDSVRGMKDDEASFHLSEIASLQAAAGLFTEAMSTAKRVDEITAALTDDPFARVMYSTTTLCKIAVAQVRAGHTEAATHNFRAAIDIASNLKDPQKRAFFLGVVIVWLLDVGRLDEAMTVADDMANGSNRVITLGDIGQALAKAGRDETARETFKTAYGIVRTLDNLEDQAFSLLVIAEGQVQSGIVGAEEANFETALDVTRELEEGISRNIILERIVHGLAVAGDVSTAVATARQLYEHMRKHAFQSITAVLIEAGRLSEAESMALELNNVALLCDVAEANINAGQMDRALTTLTVASNLVPANLSGYLWDYPLRKLAIAYAHAGKVREAIDAAKRISLPRDRAPALVGIANTF